MQKILVVEDQSDLQDYLNQELRDWFSIVSAYTIGEARQALERERFDLIVLDIQLPDGNGVEFCAEVRSTARFRDLPIIFLTARAESADKVVGFSIGADDYIGKPFDPLELRVRIQARLRRRDSQMLRDQDVTYGKIRFDRIKQRALVIQESQERDLNLTPLEFKILYFLASQGGQVFHRADLIRNVCEHNIHVNEENIYTHISAIRRKLADCRDYVECLPRVGYRFNLSAPA